MIIVGTKVLFTTFHYTYLPEWPAFHSSTDCVTFVLQRQTCCIWRHQLEWGSLMLKVAPHIWQWMTRQQVFFI